MKKKKSRRPVRRRSVALVVRDSANCLSALAPPRETAIAAMLGSDPIITASFIGTLKLSANQIDALRRPVDDAEVDWKPTERDGPPVIPYLSHNGYRDRLDAAFGLGGWGMVPIGMPKRDADFVYAPFALVIDGLPRIYAWGEQQIHKMTYGDALEGAKSNAIVRCGKELGIARDLWSKRYIDALKARRGTSAARHDTPQAQERPVDPTPISEPQKRRLWAIVKTTGRQKSEVVIWLTACYNVQESALIKRSDYQAIIAAIEKPGPLPMPEDQ